MVRWLVRAGDAVRHGQGLMEVMTDKATMEVPAPFAGTVTELRVQPGATVKVGDLILSYSPAGAVPERLDPPRPPAVHRPDGHEPLPTTGPLALGSNGHPADGSEPEPVAAGAMVKASPSVR